MSAKITAVCIIIWMISLVETWAEDHHPYIILQISEEALSFLVEQEVADESPVDDVFAGADIRGTASTKGRPRIVLQDDENAATFQIVFQGTTNSKTEGERHPVTIHSHASTKFRASK